MNVARLILVQTAVCALLTAGTGCGYHYGSLNRNTARTVAVPVFQNKSPLPQIRAQITDAVIKQFQAEGSLRVVSDTAADLTILGTIVDVKREPLRYERLNQSIPREYRLTIVAVVSVKNSQDASGMLTDVQFTGHTDYFVTADMQAAEAQAMPLAVEDLARQIVRRVTERW